MLHWLPSFQQLSAAWLFMLLIPVLIFYFLKLRRNRMEISSLALWQQVVNDQRVNAPFQRFKRNLLLLLQLLLLACLALAAMQPFLPGDRRDAQHLPVLIDNSASMAAVDASGKSRLDLAREEVGRIIDGLLPGQMLSLISVGQTARRLTEFTDNKPQLRQALDDLRADDVPSRIEDGLRLCQALARTHPIERIRFYSDGNLPTREHPVTGEPLAMVDIDLPFAIDFFQIPPVGPNLGITAMNARRTKLDRWDVFLRIDSSRGAGSEADVALKSDGRVIGEERVILSPGESQRLVFALPASSAARLEATLAPRGSDSLASDNRAWLDLPVGRDLNVYCADSLPVFRHALQALEGVNLTTAGSSAEIDLLVSDRREDDDRQAALRLFVGAIPSDLSDLLAIRDEPSEVIDWQREAALFQHVQLRDVLVSESPVKQEGATDDEIERRGYEILAHGTRGPLALRKRSGEQVAYYLLIHPERSTLPYRVGFPVLVSNLVTEAMQRAALGDVVSPATGVLPPLRLSPRSEYRVTSPDGRHDDRTSDDDGILAGVTANRAGEYQIRSGSSLIDRIGVGLLNPIETSLGAVERIHFNEISVEAAGERLKEDKPLWRYVALAAFALLLLEWWYFQRRPAGIPDSA